MKKWLMSMTWLSLSISCTWAQEIPESFCKRYTAEVSGRGSLEIWIHGNTDGLRGTLSSADHSTRMDFRGTFDDDGSWVISLTGGAEENYQVKEIWRLKPQDQGKIVGTVENRSTSQKTPVQFSENYTPGSQSLELIRVDASWKRSRRDQKIGDSRVAEYLQLTGDDSISQRINDQLRAMIFEQLQESEQGKKKPRITPTEADIEALVWDGLQKEDVEGLYDYERVMSVIFQDRGLLCVSVRGYEYSGGAHGNHHETFAVFSLVSGEKLSLQQVFKPGYIPVMEAEGRKLLLAEAKAAEDASLEEAGLFENQLKLNNNWFIHQGGLGFLYVPYEIASYARGDVEFVIPWQKLQNLINPDEALAPFLKKP